MQVGENRLQANESRIAVVYLANARLLCEAGGEVETPRPASSHCVRGIRCARLPVAGASLAR